MAKVTLLAQLLQHLPTDEIRKKAHESGSNKHSKGIDAWTHLVSMIFCHLSNASSVRDISNGLKSITGNLNHLGCEKAPSKSSVSYINQHRDSGVFEEFFHLTLKHLGQHVGFKRKEFQQLRQKVFLMDATVIPLCAKVFDWARFRRHKGAVKLHLVLDYDGCLPSYAVITDGKVHESKVAKTVSFPTGSVVVFDRGYVDFKWLNDLDSKNVTFVTRAKANMAYEVLTANVAAPDTGVLRDETIRLTGASSNQAYPRALRRVVYLDTKTDQEFVFLTNQLSWTAQLVADLYKERWHIESFFKHIKSHLRIKSFVGTSENAVRIQLWTALITILLLKAMKQIARYEWHLSNLITFLRMNLFVKIDLYEYLNHPFKQKSLPNEEIQLGLFT
jgi:hypothetical protein